MARITDKFRFKITLAMFMFRAKVRFFQITVR